MKKVFLAVFMFTLLMSAGAYAYDYNAADFSDLKKMTDKLTDNNLAKLKKWNASKIIVVECAGEFLQSKEVSNSVFSQRTTGTTITTTSTLTIGNEYYNSVINRFYEMIKKTFTENGFEIVPREKLTALEGYKALDLDFEKTTKGYTGSALSQGVSTKGIKVSAEGLGLFPTSPFKIVKLMGNLSSLTNASGANAAMKINFYIDKTKKGAPVLRSMDLIIYADLRGYEVGFEGNKKMAYDFHRQNENIFRITKPIVNDLDIAGEEKGSVDMAKYDKGLMEALNAAVAMLNESFKEN